MMKPSLVKFFATCSKAPVKVDPFTQPFWVKNMVAVDDCGMVLGALASFRDSERRPFCKK